MGPEPEIESPKAAQGLTKWKFLQINLAPTAGTGGKNKQEVFP